MPSQIPVICKKYWNIEMIARNNANKIQLSEKCIADVAMEGRDQN